MKFRLLQLSLSVLLGASAPVASAADAAEVEVVSPTRSHLSLDGVWQYQPAAGEAAKQPAGKWATRPVPDVKGKDDRMWYQRTFNVPADWKGREIVLDFERISTDATVWVNGQEAGKIAWPGGSLEVTGQIKFGEENEVRLLVVAVDDLKVVTQFMGYLDEPTQEAKLDHRGIIGAVTLSSRPAGGHVADVFIQPSVREKKVGVRVELEAVPKEGALEFQAEMLNEEGEVEKTFTASGKSGAGKAVVDLEFDWADPRLWDYRQPNLYTLKLTVAGGDLRDVYVQRFGFREFWIEGRKFFLNGTEYKLRPDTFGAYAKGPEGVSKKIDQGFNFLEMWPQDYTRRGSLDPLRGLAGVADEAGMPIAANVAHMKRAQNEWENAGIREEWRRIMEQDVRHWRNHPSVVMYSHTPNALAIGNDGDPWLLGMKDFSVRQDFVQSNERVRAMIDEIKALDPKPVFAHHGAYNGDVYTSNLYLDFIPLQEREEWISHWAEHGQLPFMAVEFGLPLYSNVMRGRSGYAHQGKSEPQMTEWMASFQGSEAYESEPAAYRDEVIVKRYKGKDPQAAYDPHVRWEDRQLIIEQAPAYQKMLDQFVTRTYRSWRGLGITGGMIPWTGGDFTQVHAVNGPALAWIAGPGGIPDQKVNDEQPLTDRTHHYEAGGEVRKQIVLINDHREPKPYKAEWRIEAGGKKLAGETTEGTLGVTETKMLPITTALPEEMAGKTEGKIVLSAEIGGQKFEDTFAFRVWPAGAKSSEKIALAAFDPQGDTSAWLKKTGFAVEPWTSGQPAQKLAVVGRGALSSGHQIPGDVEKFVREGGRLLVFTQDAEWLLHALHLRTAPQQTRQAFVAMADHPVLAGLDADDLSYWNGSSTAAKGYPHYPNWEWAPGYAWHWGNRHTVSSAPIEKPHHGSWTPIVEQEFDLAYTPLMFMGYGKGLVVLNTFDVEARTHDDPAAAQLTRQLVQWAAAAEVEANPERVGYLGGDAGQAVLDRLGVRYEKVSAPDTSHGLVIVGSDFENDAALRSYLESGGRAVILPRETAQAPLGVTLQKDEKFLGSTGIPAFEESLGLTPSDLRYRAPAPAWILTKKQETPGLEVAAGGQLGRLKVGQGTAIFAQFGPDALPADEKKYLRFTRWRQTRALSQVLANMGATFEQDAKFLALLKTPDHYVPLAGTWKVQAVDPQPEAPGKGLGMKPISERARNLIEGAETEGKWVETTVPGYVEGADPEWRWVDGEFVYRKQVDWPEHAAGKPAILSLGRVDESETSFINGKKIGTSSHWLLPRAHAVPAGVTKAGENTISVRVWDQRKHGGMAGEPRYLYLAVQGEDPGFYHADYLDDLPAPGGRAPDWQKFQDDWKVADDPYRYYRW